jgi:hypothetical protein
MIRLDRLFYKFSRAKDASMINPKNWVDDEDQREFVRWGKSFALHYAFERHPSLFTFDVDAGTKEPICVPVQTPVMDIENFSER